MTTWFLVVVTVLLGFVAGIWSGKGLPNIAIKVVYIVVAVWAAGLTVTRLGWVS